jgi:hypothetical protein
MQENRKFSCSKGKNGLGLHATQSYLSFSTRELTWATRKKTISSQVFPDEHRVHSTRVSKLHLHKVRWDVRATENTPRTRRNSNGHMLFPAPKYLLGHLFLYKSSITLLLLCTLHIYVRKRCSYIHLKLNRCRTVLHHSVCTLASTMCYVPRARFRQHNYYINRVAVTMIFTRCNCLKPNGAHNCSLEIQRVTEWWSCNEWSPCLLLRMIDLDEKCSSPLLLPWPLSFD